MLGDRRKKKRTDPSIFQLLYGINLRWLTEHPSVLLQEAFAVWAKEIDLREDTSTRSFKIDQEAKRERPKETEERKDFELFKKG